MIYFPRLSFFVRPAHKKLSLFVTPSSLFGWSLVGRWLVVALVGGWSLVGRWSVVGRWSLVVDCWLVIGYWSLVVGWSSYRAVVAFMYFVFIGRWSFVGRWSLVVGRWSSLVDGRCSLFVVRCSLFVVRWSSQSASLACMYFVCLCCTCFACPKNLIHGARVHFRQGKAVMD